MPSSREMRSRIRSVGNIAQVTRALQAVSASRARKAEQAVAATRPYASKAWQVLQHLSNQPGRAYLHPLLTERAEQRRILWNRDERPLCRICHKPISWEDVTIDQVKAWSRGGATTITNAQIAHRRCNSRKGAR